MPENVDEGAAYIFSLASSRLDRAHIQNGGKCLEYDVDDGKLVLNACDATKVYQQWIWDESSGDVLRNMGKGHLCAGVDYDSIPLGDACPPKNTPLVFQNCEFRNKHQKWRLDDQSRIVMSYCPHSCMVYHSDGWIYQQNRMFTWPCQGSVVPFTVIAHSSYHKSELEALGKGTSLEYALMDRPFSSNCTFAIVVCCLFITLAVLAGTLHTWLLCARRWRFQQGWTPVPIDDEFDTEQEC